MHEDFLAACHPVLGNTAQAHPETLQPSSSTLGNYRTNSSREECWTRYLILSKAICRALQSYSMGGQAVAQRTKRTHSARVRKDPLLSCQKTQQTCRTMHVQRPHPLSHTCKFTSGRLTLFQDQQRACMHMHSHSQTHPEYRSDLNGCSRPGRLITLSAAAASE